MTRLPGATQRRWPLRGAVAVLGAVLVLIPLPAAAATPTVTVNPDSGGPGVKVVLRGHGFCGTTACGTVSVTMGGFQVAGDIHPDAGGSFTTSFVVPGGLTSGQIYVIAAQKHSDGNEAQAMTGFLSSPSKGEEAERQAEEAETLQQLVNPSRPAATRGVPLASAAEQGRPSSAGTASSASASTDPRAATRAEEAGGRWWLYALVAGTVATLAALAVYARRRNRVDVILDPKG